MLCGLCLESNTWLFEREIYSEEFITQFRRNSVSCVFIQQLDYCITSLFPGTPEESRS